MSGGSDLPLRQPAGRVSQAITRLWMKPAHVLEVEPVGANFRLVTLASPAFKAHRWIAGEKVQIGMGGGFSTRTFTPTEWDATAGTTRIVGYAHGDGPGSAWLTSTQAGAPCDVFGPRRSLDVSGTAGRRVLLGDETSIGLACAFERQAAACTTCLLEVSHVADAQVVLARLGLDHVVLFERTVDATQRDVMLRHLLQLAAPETTFVLTGSVALIQRLQRGLKAAGLPANRLISKAYWAAGKTGLD